MEREEIEEAIYGCPMLEAENGYFDISYFAEQEAADRLLASANNIQE